MIIHQTLWNCAMAIFGGYAGCVGNDCSSRFQEEQPTSGIFLYNFPLTLLISSISRGRLQHRTTRFAQNIINFMRVTRIAQPEVKILHFYCPQRMRGRHTTRNNVFTENCSAHEWMRHFRNGCYSTFTKSPHIADRIRPMALRCHSESERGGKARCGQDHTNSRRRGWNEKTILIDSIYGITIGYYYG